LYKRGEACPRIVSHSSFTSLLHTSTYFSLLRIFRSFPTFSTMKSIVASAVVALSALMVQAASSNHVVTVGANGELSYTPNNLVAAVGDTITFQFVAGVLPPNPNLVPCR